MPKPEGLPEISGGTGVGIGRIVTRCYSGDEAFLSKISFYERRNLSCARGDFRAWGPRSLIDRRPLREAWCGCG